MPFVKYGNHTIEIRLGSGGQEDVFYDGDPVSSRMTRATKSTHQFSVEEENENVTYEVKIGIRGGLLGMITGYGVMRAPKIEVYRNGKKIYSS